MLLSIEEFHNELMNTHYIWVSVGAIRKACTEGMLEGAQRLGGDMWMIPSNHLETFRPKTAKPAKYDKVLGIWRKP